jgi:hypothetical protein
MPFPRAFYRAVANLSRPRPLGEDAVPPRVEIDLIDLDFDQPEEALEALRRVVAEAREGEQLVLLRKGPAKDAEAAFRPQPKTTRKSGFVV